MKIALPSNKNMVDGHFGHCEYFTIFTVDDRNEIISEDVIQPPAGCGCKSTIVHTLAHMGVQVMLAGNMGPGAVRVLNSQGIQVIRGCSGHVREVTQKWLQGGISDAGSSCHEHGHACHAENR